MGTSLRGLGWGAAGLAAGSLSWWACGGDFTFSAPDAQSTTTSAHSSSVSAVTSGTGTGGGGVGGSSQVASSSSASSQASSGVGGSIAPACPGEAPMCVNEWLTEDKGLTGITDIGASGPYLYIAVTNAVYRAPLGPNPIPQLIAGNPAETGSKDGPGADARFNQLAGMAVDAEAGILYLVDAGNCVIRKITADKGFPVTTIAGKVGDCQHVDTTTPGTGRLKAPLGLALDQPGNMPHAVLYVVDQNYVRTIGIGLAASSAGSIATIAGQDQAGADNNAVGLSATFNGPVDLFAGSSTVVITDQQNNRVRAMSVTAPNGVSSFCGVFKGFNNGDCSSSAAMNTPTGITAVPNGYAVSDTYNNSIRGIAQSQLSILAGGKINTHKVGIGYDEAGIVKPTALWFRGSQGAHELYIVEAATQIRRMPMQ